MLENSVSFLSRAVEINVLQPVPNPFYVTQYLWVRVCFCRAKQILTELYLFVAIIE